MLQFLLTREQYKNHTSEKTFSQFCLNEPLWLLALDAEERGRRREGRCNLPQFDLIQLCQIALAAAGTEGGKEKGTVT